MDSSLELEFGIKSIQEQPLLQNGGDEKEVVEQVGRINDLPDHIIARILSFLRTEEAIRTCILCSRWRYLWKGITRICLMGDDFEFDTLSNLVEHVLHNCSSTSFQAFKLYCPEIINVARLSTLMSCILSRKIEELILQVNCEREDVQLELPRPPLPQCILSCSTLVDVKLDYFDIEIPQSIVCFPRLKSLDLGFIFSNYDGVNRLLSCCPVLEKLYLFGFPDSFEMLKMDISISISTLRKLDLWLKNEDYMYGNESKIIINTPNLNYLTIGDEAYVQYVMKDLTCLHYAEVAYQGIQDGRCVPDNVNHLLGFLKGIEATKSLTLFWYTPYVLGSAISYTWPTFSNMVTLILQSTEPSGWTCFSKLLHSAPNLKNLVLNLDNTNDLNSRSYQQSTPETVPICLSEHLEVIGISGFHGHEDTLQFVEYLLNNAHVLDHMMISSYPDPIDEEVLQKLLMFPRASKTCNVQVYECCLSQRLMSLLPDLPTKVFF